MFREGEVIEERLAEFLPLHLTLPITFLLRRGHTDSDALPENGTLKKQKTFFTDLSSQPYPRSVPSTSTTAKEAYAESSSHNVELDRLRSQFKGMVLRANAKVTNDRVFSMAVHPDPERCVVCVGDKYGTLGM